ncbi:MAG: glycosyltransferase family 2 protein [Bacteroidales bacterium]|nr:glycosyltransferase family 2 protein [Bacteroidales bacterium]
MQPAVSVIMPYYNAAESLKASIGSILNQDYDDYELILVDNNSDDESYDIASQYSKSSKKIRLIKELKKGMVFALNAGIENSAGKYIAFSDINTISDVSRLGLQYEFLERNPDVDLNSCCVKFDGNELNEPQLFEYIQWNNRLISHDDIFLNQFIEPPVIHSSLMLKRKLIDKYGKYRIGCFQHEYELILRFLNNSVKMYKLTNSLVELNDSINKLSEISNNYSEHAFYEIKSYYLYKWLKRNNRFFPKIVVWGAGRDSRQRFSFLQDLGISPKFFIDQWANPPRNVIEYKQLSTAGKNFIVSYVKNREARGTIREFLVNLRYTEGKDFICVT